MWNKIKSLFSRTTDVEEGEEQIFLVIWGVLEGPYTLQGVLTEEDEETPYYNLCKVSISSDSEVFQTEVYFDSFESAYNMKRHFDKTVDPILVPIGDS